ncbi:MAG: CDP-alcohol phosphatidyltransferase family protein [Candidatus Saccharimonadales bacterium]
MGEALISRVASWAAVRKQLVEVQKSNWNAPAYSRWINRPLGRIFAATGYKLGVSPNMITAISACFTFPGILLLASCRPSWPIGVVISALLVVGYALDSADGQVARLRGGGTPAGEWLDHVIDSVKMGSLHIAVAIMWFHDQREWPVWTVLIPLLFQVVASVSFFSMILTDLIERESGAKVNRIALQRGERPSVLMSLIGIPADYGFMALSFALLGWFTGWRWLYVALFVFNVLLLAVLLVRWYRRVAAGPQGG